MRIAAISQRLCLIRAGGAIDVHAASNGQIDADPAAVGLGRAPQRWLQPGDVLTSYIEGIGEMRHAFVTA